MSSSRRSVRFGAVYFRKSNPPCEDWEQDYRTAAEDGLTLFRHWVPWGAVEIAPGKFDWEDYDRQLDLARKHGIRTVLAEMLVNFPEWLHAKHPHARLEDSAGRKRDSGMHVSCVTGGVHSMCLDHPEIAERAGMFLEALAKRYRGHPALHAYDVWNECSFYGPGNMCYCPATQARFREWLERKYGDLETLARAWFRFSFTEWDEVQLPRYRAPYPDFFDSIEFQIENAFSWMKWRVDTLKKHDPDHAVAAHGNGKSHLDIAPAAGDDWRAGDLADIFGYTYWYSNNCHPLMAGDMIRSASRGKTFWRAEAVGGNEWTNRRVEHAPHVEKESMADPANIRLDVLVSLAAGARGYQNPRWRPLLDGPLFGAYGWYGMDGSRTERSETVSGLAKWAAGPELQTLWGAEPVRGEVAVVLIEEAQAWCYAHYGSTEYYADCLKGTWQAFLDANIQADIVKPDQIRDYQLAYAPFPVALRDATAGGIRDWVRNGGRLVSEACFGYFGERGHAHPQQPNRGFAEAFGCREAQVSFAPDMWNGLAFKMDELPVTGGLFRQSYVAGTGQARGGFVDGATAVVENAFGKGRARIVGSMPGFAYQRQPDTANRKWFASLLSMIPAGPLLTVNHPGVIARLSRNGEERFLWIVNLREKSQRVRVGVDKEREPFGKVELLRGKGRATVGPGAVSMSVDGRDAAILRLV